MRHFIMRSYFQPSGVPVLIFQIYWPKVNRFFQVIIWSLITNLVQMILLLRLVYIKILPAVTSYKSNCFQQFKILRKLFSVSNWYFQCEPLNFAVNESPTFYCFLNSSVDSLNVKARAALSDDLIQHPHFTDEETEALDQNRGLLTQSRSITSCCLMFAYGTQQHHLRGELFVVVFFK